MGLEEPKEFNYLNLSDSYKINSNPFGNSTNITISLSKKVNYQKRIVYDIFMMFGDVGGLNDFLGVLLSSFFGLFSDYLLNGAMVRKMFRTASSKSLGSQSSKSYRIDTLT